MGEVDASVGGNAGEAGGVGVGVDEGVDVDVDVRGHVNGDQRVMECQAAGHLDSLEEVRHLKAN